MYPKRMAHPNHGYHHCYDKAEEAAMRKNGWAEEAFATSPDLPKPKYIRPSRRPK